MQKWYGILIRNNLNAEMFDKMWNSFDHYLLTDTDPMHDKCSVGINSWCKHQRSLIAKDEFKHPCKIKMTITLKLNQF